MYAYGHEPPRCTSQRVLRDGLPHSAPATTSRQVMKAPASETVRTHAHSKVSCSVPSPVLAAKKQLTSVKPSTTLTGRPQTLPSSTLSAMAAMLGRMTGRWPAPTGLCESRDQVASRDNKLGGSRSPKACAAVASGHNGVGGDAHVTRCFPCCTSSSTVVSTELRRRKPRCSRRRCCWGSETVLCRRPRGFVHQPNNVDGTGRVH